MPETIKIDLYYCFICPWVFRANKWLDNVNRATPGRVDVTYKMFSLEQVNNKNGPDWHIWEQPDTYASREMAAFRAVEAARMQGEAAFDRMRLALMAGRHERRADFTDPAAIEAIAQTAQLDMERYHKDLASDAFKERLAAEHTSGVKRGVFGTPNYNFENGASFFLRFTPPDEPAEAARIFEMLYQNFVLNKSIDELKRTRQPD